MTVMPINGINTYDYSLCHPSPETGTGTFGRVRLVRHFESGHYYALKISKKASIIKMKQVIIATRGCQINNWIRVVNPYTAGPYTLFERWNM